MKKLLILLAILCISGCATWCASDEDLAKLEANRKANPEGSRRCFTTTYGRLVCKENPPIKNCVKLANDIYDCVDWDKAEARL